MNQFILASLILTFAQSQQSVDTIIYVTDSPNDNAIRPITSVILVSSELSLIASALRNSERSPLKGESYIRVQ